MSRKLQPIENEGRRAVEEALKKAQRVSIESGHSGLQVRQGSPQHSYEEYTQSKCERCDN